MKHKRFFISYSSRDEKITTNLNLLIKIVSRGLHLNVTTFYAQETLKLFETRSKEFKQIIITEMRQSSHCIAVFTRNSINNKWVTFELGLAAAKNIKIIPLKVSGIDPQKLAIVSEKQFRDLSDATDIHNLLVQLFTNSNDSSDEKSTIEKEIQKITVESNINYIIEEIINQSKEHCIYIVGRNPKEDDTNPEEDGAKKEWNNRADQFVRRISEILLDNNFKLSSFPSVENVGKVVMEVAASKNQFDKYEIAGLYNFDKIFDNNLRISSEMWNATLSEFRKIYLANKESIIIVGGGDGTKKEYLTAREIGGIQIFPIPCFGGFGLELFREGNSADEHPCSGCSNIDAQDKISCPRVELIINRLSKIQINND